MTGYILDDVFKVTAVDPEGRRFDQVSRIVAESESHGLGMQLDVNVALYPVSAGNRLTVALARSLAVGDGAVLDADAAWRPGAGPTLADRFDYVVHGRVFKFEEVSGGRMAIYVSFGGLLLRLEGEPRLFADIVVGSQLYLLARKV